MRGAVLRDCKFKVVCETERLNVPPPPAPLLQSASASHSELHTVHCSAHSALLPLLGAHRIPATPRTLFHLLHRHFSQVDLFIFLRYASPDYYVALRSESLNERFDKRAVSM